MNKISMCPGRDGTGPFGGGRGRGSGRGRGGC